MMSYLRERLLTGKVWWQHMALHHIGVGRSAVAFLVVVVVGAAIEV
jgi:hypothetical protein